MATIARPGSSSPITTLLVVREGFVERASVQKAAEQLRAAGANLVGTVMNCCDTATSAYYAAYGDKAE